MLPIMHITCFTDCEILKPDSHYWFAPALLMIYPRWSWYSFNLLPICFIVCDTTEHYSTLLDNVWHWQIARTDDRLIENHLFTLRVHTLDKFDYAPAKYSKNYCWSETGNLSIIHSGHVFYKQWNNIWSNWKRNVSGPIVWTGP